jgi:hypothetical protein
MKLKPSISVQEADRYYAMWCFDKDFREKMRKALMARGFARGARTGQQDRVSGGSQFANSRNRSSASMGEFVFRKVANPLISLDYRPSLGRAKHVATTFKAQADHFQGLREPFSQPKFHPLHSPATGRQCVRMRDRKMDTAAIAITTCVGLYVALRLTLRVYFPPDT